MSRHFCARRPHVRLRLQQEAIEAMGRALDDQDDDDQADGAGREDPPAT